MTDREFLLWLVDRLVHVYGESPSVDFVHRLRSIAGQPEQPDHQRTDEMTDGAVYSTVTSRDGVEVINAAGWSMSVPWSAAISIAQTILSAAASHRLLAPAVRTDYRGTPPAAVDTPFIGAELPS